MAQGARKRVKAKSERRSLRGELMAGVASMNDHRKGRLTLRAYSVEPLAVRPLNARLVRETRARFGMSQQVFARSIGVNPRTLERWEQGRSRPNDQATVLIWLLRVFPDTLARLECLAKAGAA